MTTRKAKASTADTPKAHNPMALPVYVGPGDEITKVMATMAADGVSTNAILLQRFSAGLLGKDEVSLGGCIEAIGATARATHGGDLAKAEAMLIAQAASLNAVYCELARRSAHNLGEFLGAAETYMRLALKAQAQCRATLETLAAIKNPPVVFARQANINNGGQQQVNNGQQVLQPAASAAPLPDTGSASATGADCQRAGIGTHQR